jgi:diguanylate cyclase (GGDEF)-like protein
MFLKKNFGNTISRNKTVFLITATITGFTLLILYISYDYSRYLNDMEVTLLEEEVESQKMQINSELMELARSRTRITSKIIDIDDVFLQDELNMELETYANRFASLRESLLKLSLSTEELSIINSHNKIVPVILPAQRSAVELAMNNSPADRKQAKQIFYDIVLPGQGEMITSFGQLIAIEKQRITYLIEQARDSMYDMKQRNNIIIVMILAFAIPVSVIVILRIRNTQNALRHSHQRLEESHHDLELKVVERTKELSELNEHLQFASENDELTMIFNRRKFNAFIKEEYERTNRANSQFSIIFIDIDFFKQYNDHYGHQEGDRCLTAVAKTMKECLPRRTDFIARYGGEEFVIILPSTDLEGGKKVAEHIRQGIVKMKIAHEYSTIAPYITVSLGLTAYRAKDSLNIDGILKKTDECLYNAKSKGRNTVVSSS